MAHSPMRAGAPFTFGPIAIPRRRQIAQNLFRIFSIKAGMRVVTCESSLEADAIYYAEADPSITWLCDQPLRLDQPIGKRPQYTLDLALQYQNGDVRYFEIKPSVRLTEGEGGRKVPPHWDQLHRLCTEWGFQIDFKTELDFEPRRQLIANWRTLLPFACIAYRDPDHQLETQILNLSGRAAGISIRDVQAAEPEKDDQSVIASIARLLHQGRLSAPLADERVVPSTVLKGVMNRPGNPGDSFV